MNFEKWPLSDSSSLTAAGGAILQWQKTFLATRGTAIMIRKKDNTQPGRRKEQRSSAALKRMVTPPGKLNMDHFKVQLTSETGKKMESN